MKKYLSFIIALCLSLAAVMQASADEKLRATPTGVSPFTESDKALIHSGNAETPFRVLQITDKQDSLFLRQTCSDLLNFVDDTTFHLFIDRMKTTMEAEQGVGIAAPQVGISKNLFLFTRLDLQEQPVQVVVNPKIIAQADTTVCFKRDGCLSVADQSGDSIRYPWIEAEYFNEKGETIRERLEGYSRRDSFTAIIFQHEYDHIQGIVFTDKLCEEIEIDGSQPL
ncbi:MAG: peptide deformylase [Bacteroidales bacterium]|nr:peptide deformylase [Bacteroidales bacterium]